MRKQIKKNRVQAYLDDQDWNRLQDLKVRLEELGNKQVIAAALIALEEKMDRESRAQSPLPNVGDEDSYVTNGGLRRDRNIAPYQKPPTSKPYYPFIDPALREPFNY